MERNDVKIAKLKAIVSHIVCESPLIDAIAEIRENRLSTKFVIQIKNEIQSRPCNDNQIILGIRNLSKLYNHCCVFCKTHQIKSNTYMTNVDKKDIAEFCIETKDLNEKDLDSILLFDEISLGSEWSLVINALAFTLYHEFGHIKYDEENEMQIEKEKRADFFAMKIVEGKCKKFPNAQIDENPAFLGALMDFIHIIRVSDPIEAEIAMTHPHPIERLYLFLEYFHINENSYLWKYAYDTIVKWAVDNNIAMTFEKESSISIKDKMLDAYHRFKK